jgi:LytS/YehU family sensor histidine kinase
MNWLSRELLFRAVGLGDYDYGVMPVRYAMELPIDIVLYTAMVVGTWTVDRRDAVLQRVVDQERLEARLAQARLQNLQLRLQPHFLFNALNTISSVMYDDPVAADTMVARLSELLRRALDTAERQEVPLRVELDLLDHYLALLEARFGDEFVCTREVEPAAAAAMVPSLLLQPLVENAVRHGSLARSGRGRVAVRIGRDGNRLVVRVDDDGPGVPAGRDVLNEGTGLGATAERLRLLYGDAHALEAGNRDGGGFRVSVYLPWRETPAGEVGAADLSDEVAPAPTPREMAHARAHRR